MGHTGCSFDLQVKMFALKAVLLTVLVALVSCKPKPKHYLIETADNEAMDHEQRQFFGNKHRVKEASQAKEKVLEEKLEKLEVALRKVLNGEDGEDYGWNNWNSGERMEWNERMDKEIRKISLY